MIGLNACGVKELHEHKGHCWGTTDLAIGTAANKGEGKQENNRNYTFIHIAVKSACIDISYLKKWLRQAWMRAVLGQSLLCWASE